MKLLYIDRENFQRAARKSLIEERLNAEVDVLASLDDLHEQYKAGKYEIVMLDPTIDDGQLMMGYILSQDPLQQTLIVSNAVGCVVKQCEECTQNHSIRRLSNPTPIPNILRMLEGFVHYACDHYDARTNLLTS